MHVCVTSNTNKRCAVGNQRVDVNPHTGTKPDKVAVFSLGARDSMNEVTRSRRPHPHARSRPHPHAPHKGGPTHQNTKSMLALASRSTPQARHQSFPQIRLRWAEASGPSARRWPWLCGSPRTTRLHANLLCLVEAQIKLTRSSNLFLGLTAP